MELLTSQDIKKLNEKVLQNSDFITTYENVYNTKKGFKTTIKEVIESLNCLEENDEIFTSENDLQLTNVQIDLKELYNYYSDGIIYNR